MNTTVLGLDREKVTGLKQSLNELLANFQVYYQNLRGLHWNIKGKSFFEPTVNYIKEGKVVDKFIYLLCQNSNCITRVVNEDVPPKFFNDKGIIRCRYCRKPYSIHNKKSSNEEKQAFADSLPTTIEPI